MKKILFIIAIFLFYINDTMAQDNYVKTTTYKATKYNEEDNQLIDIQYLDGLGRANQTVLQKRSPNKKDIITHIDYNDLGLQETQFLSYGAKQNNGNFRSEAEKETEGFYPGTAANPSSPYALTIFDGSPLNRPIQQGAPGLDWQPNAVNPDAANTVRTSYGTNEDDDVICWQVFSNGSLGFSSGFWYPNSELYKTQTTDENGNITVEFTDKEGRVILSRALDVAYGDEIYNADTYYVYDHFGRLSYVIPPQGTIGILENTEGLSMSTYIERYVFEYKYDARHRVIEQKVPGKEWEYFVYDLMDRVILSQSGIQRFNEDELKTNQWSFTKYDILGRPVLTGWYYSDENRETLQNASNSSDTPNFETNQWGEEQSATHGYTMLSFPNDIMEKDILTITYYDDYDTFDSYIGINSDFNDPNNIYKPTSEYFPNVKDQVTATKVRILDDPYTTLKNEWLVTVNFYDDRQRLLESRYNNQFNGQGWILNEYESFTNNPSTTTQYQNDGNSEYYVHKVFNYDHADRLTSVQMDIGDKEEISNNAVTLSAHKYNEIARLVEKNLHVGENKDQVLQSIDYYYNIRGWLTAINTVKFMPAAQSDDSYDKKSNCDLNPTETKEKVIQSIYQELKSKDFIAIGTEIVLTFDDLYLGQDENDLFAMDLFYNGVSDGTINGEAQYNGNISGMHWIHKGEKHNGYAFSYDKLNRLENADHKVKNKYKTSWAGSSERYSVNNINYDLNGNILALKRLGATSTKPGPSSTLDGSPVYPFGTIDDLNYKYTGNQLEIVNDQISGLPITNDFSEIAQSDFESEYRYDDNGNMTRDENKGITIAYNFLNLPIQIKYDDGNSINWRYDALGNKLAKTASTIGNIQAKPSSPNSYQKNKPYDSYDNSGSKHETKFYSAGFEYTISENKPALEAFYHEEGRITPQKEGVFQYEYSLKDHLGNTRVYFTDTDGDFVPEVLQRQDYYPFGMTMNGNNYNTKVEKEEFDEYQYNGKERNDDFDLNWLDYGARFYDPAIARWSGVDPLASKMSSNSPYLYANNNPISFVDIGGLFPWRVHIRSFISADVVGGLFLGDRRGASFGGKSRIHSSFIVDPSAGTVYNRYTRSDYTIFLGTPPGFHPYLSPAIKRPIPEMTVSELSDSGNLLFSHEAKDPLTPGFITPDADLNASLSFSEDLENGILYISGSFTGDTFPSAEAFIQDQSGRNLFLGASFERGNILSLFFENNKSKFDVHMQVLFDLNGNFTGVRQGQNTYSVEEWNQKVQSSFNK